MNNDLHTGGRSTGEGDLHGRALLASKKTLKEILEVATAFERTAHEFYMALIPRVSEHVRGLVEELAAEELEHIRLFTELAARPDIAAEINREIIPPVDDQVFSSYVHQPTMGESPTDQTILQYALFREYAAMEQYRELALNTEPGPVHDLFQYLAREEYRHKRELEKTYDRIVRREGV